MDSRTGQLPRHLARPALPTLFVLGHCDARRQARHRTATRELSARHRTEVLKLLKRPRPVRGALQAFACLRLAWLDTSLPREVPGASGNTSVDGPAPPRSTDTGATVVLAAAQATGQRGDPAHAPGSGRDRS
jgi:hypothetical protein